MSNKIFRWLFMVIICISFVFSACRSIDNNNNIEVQLSTGFLDAQNYEFIGEMSEGLIRVRVRGKEGFINPEGKIVIEPQYDSVEDFSESLAGVRIGDKWGAIDKQGNLVIPAKYNIFKAPMQFKKGLAAVRTGTETTDTNGKWVYINQSDEIVIDLPGITMAKPFFENDRAFVQVGGGEGLSKWGMIDSTGKYVVKPIFKWDGHFSEGLAAVIIDDQYGYIDSNGKTVIPYQYDTAWEFKDGKAKIEKDGEIFYIDKQGNVIERIETEEM